ncbi:MAG: hypothetical protein ACRDQC_01385 [Gaiellales bacterium]
MDEGSFDMVAAGLRADATDLNAFVEALAVKLAGALPGRVTIARQGGLFSRSKGVREISVDMGDSRYSLVSNGGRIETTRRNEVRGIAIKSEPLELDEWIAALSRELEAAARESADGRQALEQLLEE